MTLATITSGGMLRNISREIEAHVQLTVPGHAWWYIVST